MERRLVLIAVGISQAFAQAPEVRTTVQDRTSLSVTIYQNGLAAIRDTRRLELPSGTSRLAFAGLLPSIRPKSATLLAPGSGLGVSERNYEFFLLSPATLVDASLGSPVEIMARRDSPAQPGQLASLPLLRPRLRPDAKPLDRIARLPRAYTQAVDRNVLVKSGDGFHPVAPDELAFRQLPSQLRASPTLLQDLKADTPGPREMTLLYSATDLTWTATYVATLDTDGKHLDLEVFATVNNQSGGVLPETALQLIAGAPNLVEDYPPADPDIPQLDRTNVLTMASAAPAPPTFKEEKLSEYPLFTLDRPVTLLGNAQKQLSLMSAVKVPIAQRLIIEFPYSDYDNEAGSGLMASPLFQLEPEVSAFSPLPVAWRMDEPSENNHDQAPENNHREWMARHHPSVQRIGIIRNSKDSNLGRALPGGNLVLQYRDPLGFELPLATSMGAAETFPQTPPQDEIELGLGRARGFHVVRGPTHRTVRRAKAITGEDGKKQLRRSWQYEIEVRITSDLRESAEVTVREPLMADWKLRSATHPGLRSGTNAYDFKVQVPARGRSTLRYTVTTTPEPVPESE